MLNDKGDIDATPEVLKSELIGRLIEQRVQVQRQLAELSATLLPSHPRIKQLTSELADVRAQIRDEATKIVKGLENESEVASARETSLRNSLNEVKSQASGQSGAEIKLRALEREAKANRDLLESYLARYRDAQARHDMSSVPANATIVSQAHASSKPSFPKIGPITLLVTAATALLAIAFVLARELMGAPAASPPGQRGKPAAAPASEARAGRGPSAPILSSPPAEPELPFAATSPGGIARAAEERRSREAQPDERDEGEQTLAEINAATDSFVDWLRRTVPGHKREAVAPSPCARAQRDATRLRRARPRARRHSPPSATARRAGPCEIRQGRAGAEIARRRAQPYRGPHEREGDPRRARGPRRGLHRRHRRGDRACPRAHRKMAAGGARRSRQGRGGGVGSARATTRAWPHRSCRGPRAI